ncbi:hypothetical protein D3C73_1148830 [compost metagenome]
MAQPFGHGQADALQLGFGRVALRFRVGAGMQFDHRGAGLGRRGNLHRVGVDEQGHANARFDQQAHGFRNGVHGARHFQAPFGGELSALFGHQANVLRFDGAGNFKHFRRDRAFQVHPCAQLRTNRVHVRVLDMAPVFTQMQRDEVGAGVFRAQRGGHRVRVHRMALLPQGGNVIDIYTKFYHCVVVDTLVGSFVVSSQPPPKAL